jgi:TetR/AcrR family transcriptional repressor of nem operon
VKVTKEKAAEHRRALVQAAGRLFRERGIDGIGVAEISKAAGLTHGALYGQFPSKGALAAEALAHGIKRGYAAMTSAKGGREPDLTDYLDFLLSPHQRDNLAGGCPMTASASEIARQDETVSACFAGGFAEMVDAIEAVLGETKSGADRRQRALAIIAAEIGTIAVARATAKSQPDLSNEILIAVRRVLGEIGGEGRTSKRKAAPSGRPPR